MITHILDPEILFAIGDYMALAGGVTGFIFASVWALLSKGAFAKSPAGRAVFVLSIIIGIVLVQNFISTQNSAYPAREFIRLILYIGIPIAFIYLTIVLIREIARGAAMTRSGMGDPEIKRWLAERPQFTQRLGRHSESPRSGSGAPIDLDLDGD